MKRNYYVILIVAVCTVGVFAGFSATYAATDSADATITNGSNYWYGQTLERSDGISNKDIYSVYENGSFVSEIAAEDGTLYVNTSDFSTGEFSIREDGKVIATYTVYQQDLEVEHEPDPLIKDEDTEVNFSLTSQRARFDVLVTAENLTDKEVLRIFNTSGQVVSNTEDGVLIESVRTDTGFIGNATQIPEGDTDFTFEVADTTASDSVRVSKNDPQKANIKFTKLMYTEDIGDTAEITINMDSASRATVQIGTETYRYNVTVNDGGDGVVTLLFNSYVAGEGGYPVSVKDDEDSLRDPERDMNLNVDGLAPGVYGMEVRSSGEITDAATVQFEEPQSPEMELYTLPKDVDPTMENIDSLKSVQEDAAIGDQLVLEINASGIQSIVSENTTLEDMSVIGDDGVVISGKETEIDLNTDKEFVPDDAAEEVYVNPKNGTIFFVLNTSKFVIDDRKIKSDNNKIDVEDEYRFSFNITSPYKYADLIDEPNRTESVTLKERTIKILTETREDSNGRQSLVMENVTNSTFEVKTPIAPFTNSRMIVRADAVGFVAFQQPNVTEDGRVNGTFDLTRLNHGDETFLKFSPMGSKYNVIVEQPNVAPSITNVSVDSDGFVGEPVVATANATDQNGDELTYTWTFAENETRSGPESAYTYQETGNYTVKLVVTDTHGLTDSTIRTVNVSEQPNNAPSVTLNVPASLEVGESAQFEALASDPDGDELTYNWTLGNGDNSELTSLIYEYSSAGTYTVEVTVTDTDGNTAQAQQEVVVEEAPTDTPTPTPTETPTPTDTPTPTETPDGQTNNGTNATEVPQPPDGNNQNDNNGGGLPVPLPIIIVIASVFMIVGGVALYGYMNGTDDE